MIDCFYDKMLFQGAVNNVPQPQNPGLGILLGALQGAVGQLPSVYANVKAQGKGKGETSESEMPGQIRAQPPAVNNPRGQNRGIPPAVNNPRGQNRGLHASVSNPRVQNRGRPPPIWSGGLNRRVGRYSRYYVFARAGLWSRAANQGVSQ